MPFVIKLPWYPKDQYAVAALWRWLVDVVVDDDDAVPAEWFCRMAAAAAAAAAAFWSLKTFSDDPRPRKF